VTTAIAAVLIALRAPGTRSFVVAADAITRSASASTSTIKLFSR
jgi:hypothetical protein